MTGLGDRIRTVGKMVGDIRPTRSDLVLGLGAVALCLSLLSVIGIPAYHRLEDRTRLAAVKGNAATLQLAAESYATQNLGSYPTDPFDLIPYLPGDRAPRNPFTGKDIVFRDLPGDVTYTSPSGGADYVIRGWGFGSGQEVSAPGYPEQLRWLKRKGYTMYDDNGFTLIELMIVVVVIGLLAAMAIPNYVNMKDHAKEASTTTNAHTLQLAAEDFAVTNEGIYSAAAGDLLPLLPGAGLMMNPFTNANTEPQFGAVAAAPGQVAIQPVVVGGLAMGYSITAFGRSETLIILSNGQ